MSLPGQRRSVSEKAPLQNQFSERVGAGRTRVEKQRHQAVARMHDERACSNVKVDIGKIRVVAGPTLRFRKNNRTQNFAALHMRRLLLWLYGFRMKRTRVLHGVWLRGDGRDRAMIRNCKPGANRDRNHRPTRACFHTRFNRSRAATAQIFSFGSIVVTALPAAIPDEETMPSEPGAVESTPNCGCSTRVAISIAVKSKTAAR
jgi:hypothetical protein